MLARVSICAQVDEPGELELAEAWLATHRAVLTYVSDDLGCGCCVSLWDVEGPADVVATLPNAISSGSDWVTRGRP